MWVESRNKADELNENNGGGVLCLFVSCKNYHLQEHLKLKEGEKKKFFTFVFQGDTMSKYLLFIASYL